MKAEDVKQTLDEALLVAQTNALPKLLSDNGSFYIICKKIIKKALTLIEDFFKKLFFSFKKKIVQDHFLGITTVLIT